MDEVKAKLKEVIAALAFIHEKIEQKVYDGNEELLRTDYRDFTHKEMEFEEAMEDYIDDNSEGAKFPWEKS